MHINESVLPRSSSWASSLLFSVLRVPAASSFTGVSLVSSVRGNRRSIHLFRMGVGFPFCKWVLKETTNSYMYTCATKIPTHLKPIREQNRNIILIRCRDCRSCKKGEGGGTFLTCKTHSTFICPYNRMRANITQSLLLKIVLRLCHAHVRSPGSL